MADYDASVYAQLAALNLFPPKGKVEEEEGLGEDFSQEKKMKMQKQQGEKRKLDETGYESDVEASDGKMKKKKQKKRKPTMKVIIPPPPSPLKTEPPSSPYRALPVCKKSLDKMFEMEVLASGVVPKLKEKKKKKKNNKKPQAPDLWKVKRDRIMKVRKSQELARLTASLDKVLNEEKAVGFDEKTATNYFYMQQMSGRLEYVRHNLLVDELVSVSKELCKKLCTGCREGTVSNHITPCGENVSVLLQIHVEEFVNSLFAKTKEGDYYVDERFAVLINEHVPEGVDIREEYSFPTYVLQQYFTRLSNPRAIAALQKLGLDLPLNADIPHGVDNVAVMSTMLSVLCSKSCLTPIIYL